MTATTTDPRAKLPETPLSGNEALKERSDYLHGTIKEELKMYCTPKVRQKKSNFWDQYKQCFFC